MSSRRASASVGRAAAGERKPLPIWIGAAVGVIVAGVILGFALRARTPPATERARTAPSATASSVARPAVTAAASPPRAQVDKVVVFPIVHPATTASAGKTAEREAVDALHAGDLRRAAELYGALAAAYPDNVAFVEAARQLGAAKNAPSR